MGKLVSRKDVSEAHGQGRRELAVPADAVITPLARDAAAALGIKIVKAAKAPKGARSGAAKNAPPALDPAVIEKVARMAIHDLGDQADEDTVVEIVTRVLEQM